MITHLIFSEGNRKGQLSQQKAGLGFQVIGNISALMREKNQE